MYTVNAFSGKFPAAVLFSGVGRKTDSNIDIFRYPTSNFLTIAVNVFVTAGSWAVTAFTLNLFLCFPLFLVGLSIPVIFI